MKLQDKGISVFFPAFNDEGTIIELVNEAFRIVTEFCNDIEVIVVNDGSSDSTGVLLDNFSANSDKFRVIHHAENMGYGAALITGFKNAKKEFIFYTDGDGQYSMDDFSKLVSQMVEGIDVVNGYKIDRADKIHRKFFGNIYKTLAKLFFAIPIRDIDCDYRLIRRSAIERIHLTSSSGVICTELIYKLKKAGCKFSEVPVNHYCRRFGNSRFFTFKRVSQTAIAFFGLWVKLVLRKKLH